MEWIKFPEKSPETFGIYWVYPTNHYRKFTACHWDGEKFSAGKYEPKGITHYSKMKLEYPNPPKD